MITFSIGKEQYLKVTGYRLEKIRECDCNFHLCLYLNYDKYFNFFIVSIKM